MLLILTCSIMILVSGGIAFWGYWLNQGTGSMNHVGEGRLVVGTVMLLAMIGIMAGFVIESHNRTYSLPAEYQSTIEAIGETRTMLIKGEKIGKGLEAIELKKRLSEMIEKKANLRAEYNFRLRSPWIFFKPYIESLEHS